MTVRTGFIYYGGKGMLAGRYLAPKYDTIIEPFAGGAAYSFRYYSRKVILYEIDPDVCAMLQYIRDSQLDHINMIPDNVKKGDKISDIIDKMDCIVPDGLKNILIAATNLGTCGLKSKTITEFGAKKWYHNTKKKIVALA